MIDGSGEYTRGKNSSMVDTKSVGSQSFIADSKLKFGKKKRVDENTEPNFISKQQFKQYRDETVKRVGEITQAQN